MLRNKPLSIYLVFFLTNSKLASIAGGFFFKYDQNCPWSQAFPKDFDDMNKRHDLDIYVHMFPIFSEAGHESDYLCRALLQNEFANYNLGPNRYASFGQDFIYKIVDIFTNDDFSSFSPTQEGIYKSKIEINFTTTNDLSQVLAKFNHSPSKIGYYRGDLLVSKWFFNASHETQTSQLLVERYKFKGFENYSPELFPPKFLDNGLFDRVILF